MMMTMTMMTMMMMTMMTMMTMMMMMMMMMMMTMMTMMMMTSEQEQLVHLCLLLRWTPPHLCHQQLLLQRQNLGYQCLYFSPHVCSPSSLALLQFLLH